MALSHLEINLRRLLKKSEILAKRSVNDDLWRLEKYIETLESCVEELNDTETKPSKDVLGRYRRRIEYLKGVLESKRMTDTVEKVLATKKIPMSPLEEDAHLNEMRHNLVVQSEKDLREELFTTSNSTDGLKKRKVHVIFPIEDDHDEKVLDLYRLRQEEVSQDMLTVMRNMREQTELAGKIIRQDTKTLEKSSNTMSKNYTHLQKESSRLETLISKSGWNCWMWILVVIMIVIFINMVFFMKVMKKRIVKEAVP